MFAKLFDHISLRSLINALSFSLLVLACIFFLPLGLLKLSVLGYSYILPAWLSLTVVLFACGFFSFLFNETQNRKRFFTGQNHLLVVLVLLLFSTQLATNNLHIVVLLPLALLFFNKLSKLVSVVDAKYLCFDLGLLAGLYSLLYGQLIFLFVLALLAALFESKLSIRSLTASILGLIGGVSFVAAIGVFVDLDIYKMWFAQLASIQLEFAPYSGLEWLTVGLILVLIALTYFSIPMLLNKANVLQRGKYTLWFMVQSALVVFTLIFNEKAVLSLFLLFPVAWLISKVLLEAKNKWFRDSLYLILLSAGVYQALSLMGRVVI
jgi:hypothetical protein